VRITSAIVGRNLRLFFRDRLNVFFSLLSGIILFLLYTLFLARMQTQALEAQFPAATSDQIGGFIDSWMFSGIVMLTTVTTGLGAMSALVDDGQSGRFADFLVSPIRRGQLVLGYLLAAVVVALTMSGVVLVLSIVYLGLVDGVWLGPDRIGAIVAIMALCCVAFAALSALIVSFVRTSGAFSALSTVMGAALGFVAGAYIPVGSLPDGVASTINALPFAQGAMLMRREFTSTTLPDMVGSTPGAEDAMRTFYGIDISVGDTLVPGWAAAVVLVAIGAGFALLAAARVRDVIR
jgi:multidrug/hemolysin transport system permease protein